MNKNCIQLVYCWFAGEVTEAMLVINPERKRFSPLGTKTFFM